VQRFGNRLQINSTIYYNVLNLPSSLQIRITFVKTLVEKFTGMSMTCRSGSIMWRFLCIGVNKSLASAWTPYWSSVERVRASQMFLSGHQSPWSDQSIAISYTHTSVHIQSPQCHICSSHAETRILVTKSRPSKWLSDMTTCMGTHANDKHLKHSLQSPCTLQSLWGWSWQVNWRDSYIVCKFWWFATRKLSKADKPASYFAYFQIPAQLFYFFLYQWTACVKTVRVNTVHWFDASSLGTTSE